jgi:hypothetical protein
MKKYKQLDLWTPISRSSDPGTSHEAEKSINKSGSRNTQCNQILVVVKDKPGLVSGEIADFTGMGMHVTSRRLADLKNRELIFQGKSRTYEGSGRKQVSWWPRGE